MDTPVMRDIADVAEASAQSPVRPDSVGTDLARERSIRRFAFDPASSPVLMAALAWDTEGRLH